MRCPIVLAASLSVVGCGGIFAGFNVDVPSCHQTRGERGVASFRFDRAGNCDLGLAVAAGGAKTIVEVDATAISKADTSDAGVVAVIGGPTFDPAKNRYQVSIMSGRPGTTKLAVYDDRGLEVDRATLTVAATSTIGVDTEWEGSGPLILVGSTACLHATTIGAHGVDLVGIGAIEFAVSGTVIDTCRRSSIVDGAFLGVDQPGEGSVDLSAVDATRSIAVHAIPREEVRIELKTPIRGLFRVGLGTRLAYELTAGRSNTPVLGACGFQAADPEIITVTDPEETANGVPDIRCFGDRGRFTLEAKRTGTTTVSCTLGTRTMKSAVTVVP